MSLKSLRERVNHALRTSDLESALVRKLRAALAENAGDWTTDGSHPPRHIRETGLGEPFAMVDPWCGDYQDPHLPAMVGWRVCAPGADFSGHVYRGIVRVSYEVPRGMIQADVALEQLQKREQR
jgi:hypothetical protein